MRAGSLHEEAFALVPAAEALPDAGSFLEASLPWITGLCFTAALLLAGGDEPRCKAGCKARCKAERSAAADTLAPILSTGDRRSGAIRPQGACP
ncbi:hypothetical protein [Variovorax sp. RA8]|uniref:hypothetical protein n=1 Tax=Variovorax sp. (strain JCM 16519 / RA8) TaxID=662548 RepID=UPI0013163D84|nr:hypothetical protein [Variovorax sp. RA8]VTU37175.1 hypothetical protein RA8CHR_05656 [Variovorax sp. RA8]